MLKKPNLLLPIWVCLAHLDSLRIVGPYSKEEQNSNEGDNPTGLKRLVFKCWDILDRFCVIFLYKMRHSLSRSLSSLQVDIDSCCEMCHYRLTDPKWNFLSATKIAGLVFDKTMGAIVHDHSNEKPESVSVLAIKFNKHIYLLKYALNTPRNICLLTTSLWKVNKVSLELYA